MDENNDKKKNIIDIIDKIHSAAHSGAFDNLDEDIIDNISNFLRIFLDIKVTASQASIIFKKPLHAINNVVYRKMPKEDRYKSHWLIKLSSLSKFFS